MPLPNGKVSELASISFGFDPKLGQLDIKKCHIRFSLEVIDF